MFFPALCRAAHSEGFSLLWQLARFNKKYSLLTHLANHPLFIRKMPQHLDMLIASFFVAAHGDQYPNFKNISAFYWLTSFSVNLAILLEWMKDERFKTAFLENAGLVPSLIFIIPNGPNQNTSALFRLARSQKGCSLLYDFLQNPSVREQFFKEEETLRALSTVKTNPKDNDEGVSAIRALTTDLSGILVLELMTRDETFVNRLFSQNEIVKMLCPSQFGFFLQCPDGIDLCMRFLNHEAFRLEFFKHYPLVDQLCASDLSEGSSVLNFLSVPAVQNFILEQVAIADVSQKFYVSPWLSCVPESDFKEQFFFSLNFPH